MQEDQPPARGRHAPPPEVRLPRQRERLLRAAAVEFAEHGYAGASSESISRRAAMSKATFYEHFANKEECILALFDRAAEVIAKEMADATAAAGRNDAQARMRAGTVAFLRTVAEHPDFAQTLLVEIVVAVGGSARYGRPVSTAGLRVVDPVRDRRRSRLDHDRRDCLQRSLKSGKGDRLLYVSDFTFHRR